MNILAKITLALQIILFLSVAILPTLFAYGTISGGFPWFFDSHLFYFPTYFITAIVLFLLGLFSSNVAKNKFLLYSHVVVIVIMVAQILL